MLEIRHLQSLIALAEAGTQALAAKRIHLSESAFSHQIKAMENEIGDALFQRKTNPLLWSPVGERLVSLAYDVQRVIADARRDIVRLQEGTRGELRIAVECHSCFDWLMPAMDEFRENWPDVELDIVSGFHPDPLTLLDENRADLVIISQNKRRKNMHFHPLFRHEMHAILAKQHPLSAKDYLVASDFATDTLITYPIPDQRLDLMRQVLSPKGIDPERRTAQLTVAILQLVASKRGIATLPDWSIQPYLDRGYVLARPITAKGLWSNLFAATTNSTATRPYIQDFVATMIRVSFEQISGIEPLD